MNYLSLLCISCCCTGQEYGERRSLWFLGNVDDLLQTGYAECDVLGGHAGVMECVQRHLGGRFSERLGRQCTDHLTGHCLALRNIKIDSNGRKGWGRRRNMMFVTGTWACWNLASISPRSQSNASVESRNSSATFLVHKVDLSKAWKSSVAFSLACTLNLSSPGTITNLLDNVSTPVSRIILNLISQRCIQH